MERILAGTSRISFSDLEDDRIHRDAVDLCWQEFSWVVCGDRSSFDFEIQGYSRALGQAAIDPAGRVVGAYLLGHLEPRYIEAVMDGALRAGKIVLPDRPILAVHGMAMAVGERYRGLGIGRALRERPRRMGADLVLGQQAKCLDNLDSWLAVRQLVAESTDSWFTAVSYAEDVLVCGIPRDHGLGPSAA